MIHFGVFPELLVGSPIGSGCNLSSDKEVGDLNLDGAATSDLIQCCDGCGGGNLPENVRIYVPGRGWPYLQKAYVEPKRGNRGFRSDDPFFHGEEPTIIQAAAEKGKPLMSPGDLVSFQQGSSTVQQRIRSFLFEFSPSGQLVRRAALFGDSYLDNQGGIDLLQLKVVSSASELDSRAGGIIKALQRALSQEVRRREEILSCADFKHLKEPRQKEILKIEGRIAVFLDRVVDSLKLDKLGKAFLRLKLEQKLGLHGPIYQLASR